MSLQKISMEFYRETGFEAIKKRQLSNIYNTPRRPEQSEGPPEGGSVLFATLWMTRSGAQCFLKGGPSLRSR